MEYLNETTDNNLGPTDTDGLHGSARTTCRTGEKMHSKG